jgi:hypothetical protein
MNVELNSRFQKASDTIHVGDRVVMVTPPIDENYFVARVHLHKNQYIVCFPKFGTIGCGFAQERDWNTNLPITSEPEVIYNHIAHNKKYKIITKESCIQAITLLREQMLPFLGKSA